KVFYPKGEIQRESYRTKDGKKVPPHHWRVYDLIQQIPAGKVTTYKVICNALGEGSPRSVGTALANNPFAPFIPCHRIIASNRTIGGFCGEKHKPGSKNRSTVSHCDWKLRMLRLEGVKFDKQGHLVGPSLAMWQP
ncbi:methylated-DNA--cysteine S-met, partial [Thelephora ganbajun]